MAPSQPARPDKDKRIKTILSFASDLEAQLPSATTSRTAPLLLQEIEAHVSNFPIKSNPFAASRAEEVDTRGTTLWNLCTRLRRDFDIDKPQTIPPLLLAARVFAFLLLDCAFENGTSALGNLTRLMKTGIKAAKSCLDQKQLELGSKVLERVSRYEDILGKEDDPLQDRVGCEPLLVEYFILRTALAWQQGQLKVAEHMFSKSTSGKQAMDPNTAQSLADVLYGMGKDLLAQKQHNMALKWLERANNILAEQQIDKLSIEATELRTSIMQFIVKALLESKEPERVERARSLIDLLENEVGGKLVVLVLKLEVLAMQGDGSFDCQAYHDVLKRMTRSLVLSDNNFRLLMFHIRKLNETSSALACAVLDELLGLRILKEGTQQQIEKIIITRLYMIIGQRESEELLQALTKVFALITSNITEKLSPAACLGALTLLWKRIESNYRQGQYAVAENWSRLAMHNLFENSGEVNMARISRKLLLCALGRNDMSSAKDYFGTMPETARNEPMTRFLMYKIAIRCEAVDLAAECLRFLSSSSSEDPTLLYASCLEAQQLGDKAQTLAALQIVVDKYGYGPPGTVHLPSLIRITIGLIISSIEGSKQAEGSQIDETAIERLCKLFEGAVTSIQNTRTSIKTKETVWTVLELDWFSKNSYNLTIKHLSIWNPRQSLRILKCCIVFIDDYPNNISEQVSEDLALRKMFCEFSSATALVALARGEDQIEIQLQEYLELRKHVQSYDRLVQEKLEKMEEESAQDLLRKLSILLTFDFEAACQLKVWDGLGEIVLKSAMCKNMHAYQLMADCLLCSQAPTEVTVKTMKRIINEAWGLDELDPAKLAKYMRCLFQVALPHDSQIANQLLDQIHDHAEQASETDQPYPAEELEWIATTAFNHAVDLYCAEKDEEAKDWAQKAVSISNFCDDGGGLERLLQEKFLGLRFEQ